MEPMREFTDEDGRSWIASVDEREGPDYKGRHHFVAWPADEGEDGRVDLVDVRWNSRHTARRTLETMSVVELRRRLRSARGRGAGPKTPA